MDEHFAANIWEYVSLYSVLPLGDFPVYEMEAARRSTRKRETGNRSYERFLREMQENMCIPHCGLHSISAQGKRIHTTAAGLDQAVTESHFCCSSLDIFLMEKVRKSCFIWLCRALKVLLNGPSSNFPRKWFLGKKVKKHACYGITQNYHLFSTTLIKYHFHAVPATFFQKFLYQVVGKFVLHRFHHKVRCWIS